MNANERVKRDLFSKEDSKAPATTEYDYMVHCTCINLDGEALILPVLLII